MQTLLLLLKILPWIFELIALIQRKKLTEEATQEMLDDLKMTTDYLIARSNEARAKVKDTPDDIANDSYSRP